MLNDIDDSESGMKLEDRMGIQVFRIRNYYLQDLQDSQEYRISTPVFNLFFYLVNGPTKMIWRNRNKNKNRCVNK